MEAARAVMPPREPNVGDLDLGSTLAIPEIWRLYKVITLETGLKALLRDNKRGVWRRSEPAIQACTHERFIVPEIGNSAYPEWRNELPSSNRSAARDLS